MSAAMTLFKLVGDRSDLFDGSVNGVSMAKTAGAQVLPANGGIVLTKGYVDLARHPDLDGLNSFTIEAVVTPKSVSGARQDIVEGQTPSIALFIDATGKLVGSIHTAAGWVALDSGAALLKANAAQRVTFTRDGQGKTQLLIDGAVVGNGSAPGAIVNVGAMGLRIGMGMDGVAFPFSGMITDLNVRQGVVLQAYFQTQQTAATALETQIKATSLSKNVSVHLVADESHTRLQHVKDIMNAAGVQALSDLDTLPIKQLTPLKRGQVLVAAKKGAVKVNFGDLAKQLRAATTVASRQELLATHLTNQNSAAFLANLPKRGATTATTATTATAASASTTLSHPVLSRAATTLTPLRASAATTALTPAAVSRARVSIPPTQLSDLQDINLATNKVTAIDPALLSKLTARSPILWPTTGAPLAQVLDLVTVPVDSAVVIAGTLDLTNQQLVVEPNVGTLYIIAETVICGAGAAITWRRPGGSTPGRADNPDLNGRSFNGVQTKKDSRDGLDGGDGQPGGPGAPGANGRDAPNVEMWVKSMTGLPNLDFNGENGIPGGGGQHGGNGGRGGDGSLGERVWAFGWHCWSQGGDGGSGGNGGRGGDGGRGGNGGNAGNISIGVLTGTLANTVVNQVIKLKNQGGQKGPGGPGGSGGASGPGGHAGNGETCTDAKDGHAGAQGQPGGGGVAGPAQGSDGSLTFFEFTQAAWDDLMQRPWITQITPTDVFPGDTLTIHGSSFTTADTVMVGGGPLTPTVNADQSISVVVPLATAGGSQVVYVKRADGTESNRVNLGIKPELDMLPTIAQGATATLTGRAFLAGASVLFDGGVIPATVNGASSLSFTAPGTGGGGSVGGSATVQVQNPDGRVSNTRTASLPRVLEIPFRYGQHNLTFPNFNTGSPSWGTFEDTFGAVEVWHELLDPIFGHPVLTAAYFVFYTYFLKGDGAGGLATGFCTSLSSLVAERFWLNQAGTTALTLTDDLRTMLTGLHGKLLSRQTLLTMHDQGRNGIANVETVFRQIEATFLRGTDRQNQPLLFFIPSGDIWDSGYFDKLSSSHCVLPYKFVYPIGHAAPQLTADGSSTISDPNGVELFIWNCNAPTFSNSRLRFHVDAGVLNYDFIQGGEHADHTPDDTTDNDLASTNGVTLGTMRHGDYMLADHDLPFSGPFGLTAFIVDFLLSPADLQVVDDSGRRAGRFGSQILSEIPDSHPCYLMKGMYLLPAATALTRTIVGNGVGTYDYHSIMPDGTSIQLQGVATQPGHQDVVGVNADATQIRFTPAVDKTFSMTITRVVDGQARAVSVAGVGGGPSHDLDVTMSPDLSLVRFGNRGAARALTVKALAVVKGGTAVDKSLAAVQVPDANDLAVTVTDWTAVDLQAQAVPFS